MTTTNFSRAAWSVRKDSRVFHSALCRLPGDLNFMTTLRIINNRLENGGEWFCEPENKQRLAYVQGVLKSMQQEEPENNWKLQTRGTDLGWHDFKP